jgi:hypothetical protein
MFMDCFYAGVPEYQLWGSGGAYGLAVAMRLPPPSLARPWYPYVLRTDWGWCMLGEAYVSYPSEVWSVPGCLLVALSCSCRR